MQNKGKPPTSTGYELKDANPRGILIFMSLVLVGCVIVYLVVHSLFNSLEKRAARSDQRATQQQVMPSAVKPLNYFPEPREQPVAKEDLETFQARANRELETYGWIDKKAGIIHVPIERAMELVLQRGLPTRNTTNQTDVGPSSLQLQQQRPNQTN